MIEKHPFQERYDIIHTVKYLSLSSRYLQGNFSNIFWYIFLNGNKKWYRWIWNLYYIYFTSRHFNESQAFRGIYNLLLMNIKWELSLCPIGWPHSIFILSYHSTVFNSPTTHFAGNYLLSLFPETTFFYFFLSFWQLFFWVFLKFLIFYTLNSYMYKNIISQGIS